jgi:hypothetical protein
LSCVAKPKETTKALGFGDRIDPRFQAIIIIIIIIMNKD